MLENNTALEEKYSALQNEFHIHHQQSTEIYQHKLQTSEHVISNLEAQNAELLKKYEATVESKEKISRQNTSSQQKLTAQVNELYSSLEQAYKEIQDHEQYRENYLKKMAVKDIQQQQDASNDSSLFTNNADQFHEVTLKMDQMMHQNQELLKTKQNIEHQVQNALLQLNNLQAQFNQAQQSKERFHLLENKFQTQEAHIHQLTSLIEEHRLHMFNDYHRHYHETMPSLIAENASHLSSDDDDDFDVLPQNMKGNSLYAELRSALPSDNYHHHKFDPLSRSLEQEQHQMMLIPSEERQIVKKQETQKRKNNSNSKKMVCIYPALRLDDSLIAPMTPYRKNAVLHARKVHTSTTMVNQITQIPFHGMYLVWRFIRFFVVIQIAMFIHLFTKK